MDCSAYELKRPGTTNFHVIVPEHTSISAAVGWKQHGEGARLGGEKEWQGMACLPSRCVADARAPDRSQKAMYFRTKKRLLSACTGDGASQWQPPSLAVYVCGKVP